MALSISLDQARTACADSVDAFVDTVGGLDEHALLAASRCHGWTRLDVVVHVLAGWQEMLGGLVSPVDGEPTVDAASYWTAFAAEAGDDPVADLMSLMAQRRRTASFDRPATAVAQLVDVAAALQRGIASCADRPLLCQGHVITAGDFLTTWAVEDVVHQLDLAVGGTAAPASALALTRASVESLAGTALPEHWSDEEVALVGSGRVPVPVDVDQALAARLPAPG